MFKLLSIWVKRVRFDWTRNGNKDTDASHFSTFAKKLKKKSDGWTSANLHASSESGGLKYVYMYINPYPANTES